MFVSMKNFKCFASARVEIEEGAFTLISAPSGFGKTTVLDAIAFCLWNVGRDVVTIGKKKCEVTVEIGDLVMRRTKGPCFFEVKQAGAVVVDAEEFVRSRFVQYEKNFVDQPAAKQMQMVEKIVNSFHIDEKLEKIKAMCKEGMDAILKTESRIGATKRAVEIAFVPEEVERPEPIRCDTGVCVASTERRLRKLKCDRDAKASAEKQLSRLAKPEQGSERLMEDLKKVQLENAGNESLKRQRAALERRLAALVDVGEEGRLKSEILNIEKIETEIKRLRARYDLPSAADALGAIVSDAERLGAYTTRLQCPNCNCKLVQERGVLIKIRDVVADKAAAAKYLLENAVSTPSSQLRAELDRIYTKRACESELASLGVPGPTIDTLAMERLVAAALEYETVERQMKGLADVSDAEIAELESAIEAAKESAALAAGYRAALRNWETYDRCRKNKELLETELEGLESRLRGYSAAAAKLQALKRCIEVSKSEAIRSTLEFLNSEISFLIKIFFEDEDVEVFLCETASVKSTKTEKPQISVNVVVRGREMKPANLSSGEMARVRLAVDMAYARLVGSAAPISLDECTANLDAELSTKIFYAIKDYFPGKTILAVSHQAVEGLFDAVLDHETLESACEKY